MNPAELLWAAEKENYIRLWRNGSPTTKTLETLLGCLKSRFEVSNYIHKPALYTQTMLLSAQDGEQVLQKRGADVIGGEKARKTLLLSELHQALRQFGFDVQRGSVELIDHAGAVPAVTVALESVVS